MTDRLPVGVIGTGGMGLRHAVNLDRAVARARLAAVMDVDLDRAREAAAGSGASVFTDAESLIASPDVDAVIIASPDPTHAPLATTCIELRKPALVEKPLAVTVDDAAAIVEREVRTGQRLLQVGFMRHFDPEHVAVRRVISSGGIGRPLLFRGWHRNPPEPVPPTSRQVLVNSAIHDLYSARWMLGQEIVDIFVRGTTIDPSRSDQLDLQLITLSMDGGGIAVIEVNKDSGYGYEVGVEITGTAGMVSTPPHHTPPVRKDGEIRQSVEPDWLARFARAYIEELTAWTSSVLDGRPTGPDAWDGYLTLKAASAGADSIERGGPVALDTPERPALYTSDA